MHAAAVAILHSSSPTDAAHAVTCIFDPVIVMVRPLTVILGLQCQHRAAAHKWAGTGFYSDICIAYTINFYSLNGTLVCSFDRMAEQLYTMSQKKLCYLYF